MSVGDGIRKNLHFWHWYPRLLCEGLTEDQLYWQPDANPNHMMFAIWHAYRSEDDIIHGLLMQKPSLFVRDGWSDRIPVPEPGNPPFGAGLNREQIAAIRPSLGVVLTYAEAVGNAIQAYADDLSDADGEEQIALPFFTLIALGCLFGSIAEGLLGLPEMQIEGNGSGSRTLHWYQDRAASDLPRAWIFSVPLMVYRFAMLAWAMWIAWSLLAWLKWGWNAYTTGGRPKAMLLI